MESLHTIPKLHDKAKWSKQENGNYFLYNDDFDSQMTISASALLVIESINGVNTIKEITDKLTQDNSKESDYQNITKFICQDLKKNYILEDNGVNATPKKRKFNKIILSGEIVNPICGILTFLFRTPNIVWLYFSLVLTIAYSLASKSIPEISSSNWLIFGVGAVVLVLAHELGHCTALRYCGLNSKGIGIGIHFVFPMIFAEVTQAWVLSPKKRLIVDLGGFHFQLITILVFFILAIQLNNTALMNLFRFSVFLFCFNLNPFIKSDVYWALSDYFSIPNLHEVANDKIKVFIKEPKLSHLNLLFVFGILRYIFLAVVLSLMIYYICTSVKVLLDGMYQFSFNSIKNDLIIIISLSVFLFGIFSKYKR